jgi:antirestriction protein ArdC
VLGPLTSVYSRFSHLHVKGAKILPLGNRNPLRKTKIDEEEKDMKKSVYEIVTERIIEELEKGVVPWQRHWMNGGAVNWKTERSYRGINAFLLPGGEYATFKQITDAGGKVKKGAKSHIVVFWTWLEKENPENGKEEKIPYLRYYRVFDIVGQVEGIESKRKEITIEPKPIDRAEEIFKGYRKELTFTFFAGHPMYIPSQDRVNCPPIEHFTVPEEYYCTLFHEMIHSTGHQSRLARPGVTIPHVKFGDENYSKEELIAEMGAAMLCGVANIHNTIENSASYIHSWIRVLKDDNRLVVQAAAQAQRAADLILGEEAPSHSRINP